ncbi:hypothetical protein [Dictyobacter formicarum]|uniref:Response regulatory domain-containing protein n=1 Tax=Dictyobacter formicarum TaxID=2778368 RepID=A0ABQ3VQB1_9CHLR|nr:hypothetical protein [Dictyobacter formicarum]GHO87788.1 hypothetical protein KSZ_57940 [Dictyobacter formicarum]
MNISTGGPHTLLFERDQQFATLLGSELQLAGYTNHTARTAVEVFDAIARYPIRLVMVNLAQAAAARREFWVALDTQRRDRQVQVLTFICTNLAGYGPRELEDHAPHTNADMEIDGMLGLMNLVDAVRSRLPSSTIPLNTSHTQPRMPRFSSLSMPVAAQHPGQAGNGSAFSATLPSDTGSLQTPARSSNSTSLPQTPLNNSITSAQPAIKNVATNQNHMPSPATGLPGSNQPSYSEKIRAVLYPNQRTWNAQDTGGHPVPQENQENKESKEHINPLPTINAPAYNDAPVLQRLASGQLNYDGPNESGLAQLSRMVQGFRSTGRDEPAPGPTAHTVSTTYMPTAPTQPPAASQWAPLNATKYTIPVETREALPGQTNMYAATQQAETSNSTAMRAVPPTTTSYSMLEATREKDNRLEQINQPEKHQQPYTAPITPAARLTQSEEKIGTQPLRASPIQDMPIERTVTGPAIGEIARRPDVLSRTNYGPQTAHQPAVNPNKQATSPHLAPISAPLPSVTPVVNKISVPLFTPEVGKESISQPEARYEPKASKNSQPIPTITEPETAKKAEPGNQPSVAQKEPELAPAREEAAASSQPTTSASEEPVASSQPTTSASEEPVVSSQPTAPASEKEKTSNTMHMPDDLAESMTTNNAVLLDIVQSLPPMPALSEQPNSVQPQVLNGRATRSLNKVLLDGHLVPQDRLDVAQNIQRMLRGVDLNYQLGEILLMFKLLTPDQLLAASLVSYGLITTTQISALGRIRQELHSMGLEYDLENLLILFRILTPEQLREVRTSLQS